MDENGNDTMPLMGGSNPNSYDSLPATAQQSKRPLSPTSSQSSQSKYQTETYRWLILLVVTLAQLSNNMIFVALSPISIPLAKAFELDTVLYVNFTIIFQDLNSVIMTFLSVWMYSRYSTSGVLRLAVTIFFIGALLRALCYQTHTFLPVVIGQIISSACNPFFINVQSIIAEKWFGDNERALATALQTLAMPLGTALSFAVTGTVFYDGIEDFRRQFERLMVAQAIFVGLVFALFNIIMKESPSVPPSRVATVPHEHLHFSKAFRALKENTNFLLLTLAFALPAGSFTTLGNLLSNLFDPFGYSQSELSFICLQLLMAGVVGTILFGALIDKTQKFKLSVFFITFIMCVSTIVTIWLLYYHPENKAGFVFMLTLVGFFCTAYIPICICFGAELTFPLQPALVNGTLGMIASGSGFLLSGVGAILNHEGQYDDQFSEDELTMKRRQRACTVMFILAVTALVAFVINIFIKEDLKRYRYSEQAKEEEERQLAQEIVQGQYQDQNRTDL